MRTIMSCARSTADSPPPDGLWLDLQMQQSLRHMRADITEARVRADVGAAQVAPVVLHATQPVRETAVDPRVAGGGGCAQPRGRRQGACRRLRAQAA